MRKLFNLLAFLLLSGTTMASHISGGEIIWDCLGGGDYEFTIILYRDCDGISMPTTANLNFTSSCGTATLSAALDTSFEVSQLCPTQIVNSTCNGGTLPGMEAYYYSGTLNLAPCADWTVSWTTCCRNAAISNLQNPGGLDSYIEANFDNLNFPCDNSARFTAQPIPYVCLNQLVNYSFGAFDPDADSLNYSLIGAREAGAAPIAYVGGFTPAQPIPGVTIDQFTGLLTFTPTAFGNYVFVVLVEQFDSQGNLIGTVMRDIQFIVITCTNTQPAANDGDILNFTGSALQTDSMSIQMCATDNFCFDFIITDINAGDSITLTSNIAQVLPGATFTYSGVNPVTGQICWQGIPGSEGLNSFTVNANDNACTIPGLQTYVYDVLVLPRTTAGPNQIICGTQVAQLGAQGGSIFTWTVLSGDPIVVGQNFSCNPCANPIASPANPTTYIVTSNLGGGCLNTDTVLVNVVPDFAFAATQTDTVVCLGEQVNFDVTVNPALPGYTYTWIPSTDLSNGNIANPVGNWSQPGTYNYVVEILSPDSCTKVDTSLTVVVVPSYSPDFTLDSDSICVGASGQVDVVFANAVPSFCGLNYAGCQGGTLTTGDIGIGLQSNSGTQYPAPYGNWFNGARHQLLFRANELQALGFSAGTITKLGFDIASLNTSTTTYENFEIRMGCTTLDAFNAQWLTGMEVVFPAQTVNIAQGWTEHTFTFGYNWDGVSNLVVEICFDMAGLGTGFTQNASTNYSTTAYNSVLFFNSDLGGVCYGGNPNNSTDRPNTRFTFCSGVDPNSLQYTWSPAGIVDPNSGATATVTPTSSPQTVSVIVGDPLAGCADSASITVNWFDPVLVDFNPQPPIGVAPLDVYFNNLSSSNVSNFVWDFGDFNGSNAFDPSNTYNTPGWYYVLLTGTDANGCLGSHLDSVEVIDEPVVTIPNVFTPNGDGVNEHFQFTELKGFRSIEMIVYNRWGGKVKELTSVPSNLRIWSPGSEVTEGTYYYTFVGEAVNGEQYDLAGHVTLLRLGKEK